MKRTLNPATGRPPRGRRRRRARLDGTTLTTIHGPRYRLLIIGAGSPKYLATMAIPLDYQGDRLRSPR